jgi:NAD(P)-dependent dehydrogenase (short-subunit alcohol dehydrogenase family)
MGFDGRAVVVTGAGGGVGRALVETFRGLGAAVVAFDRDEGLLAPLDAVHAACFDLTDRAALARETAAALDLFGAPAAVVSNAGWTRAETLAATDLDAWDRETALNLDAAAALTFGFLPAMRAAGRGAFVYVASVNALAHFGNPAYAAAKAGLLGLMRAVATEAGRDGVRANAVVPGSIRTPAWDHRVAADPGVLARVSALYPLGRMVEPREVAEAVAFLASGRASGITGVALPVDAGLMAGNLPFLRGIGG